jgi:rod shape-determining protein MreB
MGYTNSFVKTVGIDPGSENLRIVHDGRIVFKEPSALSIHEHISKISGIGLNCVHSEGHRVVKPVVRVLYDFMAFEHLLRRAIKQSLKESNWFPVNYKMFFSIPGTTSEVEKRAYRDSAEHAGARDVYMIHQPIVIALGMRVLMEKKHFMLIDFGASKIEMSAFAASNPIAIQSSSFGTWKMRQLVSNYLRRNQGIIAEDTLLDELMNILFSRNENEPLQIKSKTISLGNLHDYLSPYLRVIHDDLIELFENVQNSPHKDSIIGNGIYVSGGGSLYHGIVKKICAPIGLKYTLSEKPFLDNINGVTRVLREDAEFKSIIMR